MTVGGAVAFAKKLGKKTGVVIRDFTGYIVNRLLMPYMVDAIALPRRKASARSRRSTRRCRSAPTTRWARSRSPTSSASTSCSTCRRKLLRGVPRAALHAAAAAASHGARRLPRPEERQGLLRLLDHAADAERFPGQQRRLSEPAHAVQDPPRRDRRPRPRAGLRLLARRARASRLHSREDRRRSGRHRGALDGRRERDRASAAALRQERHRQVPRQARRGHSPPLLRDRRRRRRARRRQGQGHPGDRREAAARARRHDLLPAPDGDPRRAGRVRSAASRTGRRTRR